MWVGLVCHDCFAVHNLLDCMLLLLEHMRVKVQDFFICVVLREKPKIFADLYKGW